MLFTESRITDRRIDGTARLELFDRLQEKGLVPLIRSTRLGCYELALLGAARSVEMERLVSAWTDAENDSPYTNGDVFFSEDFALFLIFGDAEDGQATLRAGIVYEAETHEPQRKLESFCRNVQEVLSWQKKAGTGIAENGADAAMEWRARASQADENVAATLSRFAAARKSDAASVNGPDKRKMLPGDNNRAIEVLNDADARRALRRIREKHAEGSLAELLANGEAHEWASDFIVHRLQEAGLLRREVLVSCRKKGRSLFRLPSPETLAVVMASNATCSECGTAIADEKVEELIAPTELAHALLEDGSWLLARLSAALREAGVPEQNVVDGVSSGDGESYMMANVCGELFLFALRDGELTSAFARHVLDKQIETEAAHLVIITTGKIQEDARVRLRDGARRRTQEGSGFELISVEGIERAITELGHAFERVSQQRLADELYALDRSLGLSVGQIIAARFQLRQKPIALKDLAESAVGALANSLPEF